MESDLNFIFRGKVFSCEVCIDCSDDPSFIFMILHDKDLISEFGDEITIKTDFVNRLAKRDEMDGLAVLRQSIFDSLKFHPLFLETKSKKISSGQRLV